ncbi:hypothetical protein GOE05_27580 [Sinorhizobium medicae]|nr:hypothetical protein [Sinorhizobium medicae]
MQTHFARAQVAIAIHPLHRIFARLPWSPKKSVLHKTLSAIRADRAGSVCLNSFGRFAKWISATDYAAAIIGVSALK